jgi:hypothetical protein
VVGFQDEDSKAMVERGREVRDIVGLRMRRLEGFAYILISWRVMVWW